MWAVDNVPHPNSQESTIWILFFCNTLYVLRIVSPVGFSLTETFYYQKMRSSIKSNTLFHYALPPSNSATDIYFNDQNRTEHSTAQQNRYQICCVVLTLSSCIEWTYTFNSFVSFSFHQFVLLTHWQ